MITVPKVKFSEDAGMPVLGLGTWQLTGRECVKSVRNALDLGYRHIDTAQMYGNETEIGEAIEGFPREELFITSKVPPDNLEHDKLLGSCAESLDKLGTDYLDLYLVHWPSSRIPIEETFPAFRELKDEGRIRAAGVSNFFPHHLDSAIPAAREAGLEISVNQVEFHPLLFDEEILEYCAGAGIVLTAYSPLSRGGAMDNAIIMQIAKKYNKTPAQVSLRWGIDKGTVVIPKAASPAHQEENINIFDFRLESADILRIDGIPEFKRIVSSDTP